jgi:hypothetical protein
VNGEEMKCGTIEVFDASTGEGVVRLIEDRGAVPVNFSAVVCRGVSPVSGFAVLVGLLEAEPGSGGPLSDTFAMRAGLVEVDRGVGGTRLVHTMGISAARAASRPGTLLVPFDASTFRELETAFDEELIGTLAFGPPVPAEKELPPQLQPLSGLLAISRPAARFRIVAGEPAERSTFAAGSFADLGDTPWPSGDEGPLLPLLQVGIEDARRIGIEQQVNVFTDGPEFSTLHVIFGEPGSRASTRDSIGEAASLKFIDTRPVFPSRADLERVYVEHGMTLPLDVNRFWDLFVAPTPDASDDTHRSIQASIGKHFPNVTDLDCDVALGGFAGATSEGDESVKRLATFFTPAFPWLETLAEEWPRAALDVSLDGEVTLYGADGDEPDSDAD